jgi:hypothetical protein
MFSPSPAVPTAPTSESVPTQRGIDTRLLAALADFREIEAAYNAGQATWEQVHAASEQVRTLRAIPMKSALDMYFGEVA